ncbi:MAG: hypothetical protein IKR02_04360 [Firmicutes bacterium]|nr:hypothetical protein [Bacillota bacterium]
METPISYTGEEQIETLKTTRLQDGSTAYDYVKSWPEADQPWVAAGILSCITKGYSLNRLTINWEARELRYGNK